MRARIGRWMILPAIPSIAAVMGVGLLLAVVAPAAAHKRHAAAPAETASVVAGDSAGGAAASAPAPPRAEPAAVTPFVMPPVREAILEHPHNKVVHAPLALGLAAALLLLLARRRPELDLAGRLLVWLAALGGAAAYFSGRAQAEAFEAEPKEWLVHLHGKWGLATAIVLGVWALLTLWGPTRRLAWLWGLVAAALVLITGFYGGIVAHGE